MKQRLASLRFRVFLPVIVVVLFIVSLLNTLFSKAFISMILKQEQEVNAASFATVSNSVVPLITSGVDEARSVMSDGRVAAYARRRFDSEAELVRARIDCRDFLQAEIASRDRVYGLLFMREDGSLFGALPDEDLFLDRPEENPLPEAMKAQILSAPLGQTVWVGPISGADICGFENDAMPRSIMMAVWKSRNESYGVCFELVLVDESVFNQLFSPLQDGKSSWHLLAGDGTEIWHTGPDACPNPEQLIRQSNSGRIFHDDNGVPVCAFSMAMDAPAWTLVRRVSMQGYERMVRGVEIATSVFGAVILLATLAIYELWLKKFTGQFQSLLQAIVRMGQGDLETATFERTSIAEFKQMQHEINRTRLTLGRQMDTIRRMEREQMEMENRKKEQERIAEELSMAREIQANALPSDFPPFPERTEFSLYASMTPAREVGGDFYDFFLTDSNHLALVIADVSDKGIPAALFMMESMTLIRNRMMSGCDPATALEWVNRQLCQHNASKMFVTVWLAVLDIATGKGLACNAGHEPPALRRRGENFELLRYRHDFLVGGLPDTRYQNRAFELHPGDSLFVYTDGVPEATSGSGRLFAGERLEMTLNACQGCGPEEILRRVKGAVDAFVGDAEQFDDLTMMCLEYRGPEACGETVGKDA